MYNLIDKSLSEERLGVSVQDQITICLDDLHDPDDGEDIFRFLIEEEARDNLREDDLARWERRPPRHHHKRNWRGVRRSRHWSRPQ